MKSTSKGYTLLFAVIVAVLLLSIAAFILSVSRKQAILSSAARDSVYAFYAADSGLECGIEHLTELTTPGALPTITCGNSPSANVTYVGNSSVGTSTFSLLTGTGDGTAGQKTISGASSCVFVTAAYVVTPPNGSNGTTTSMYLTSRGYNIGWNSTAKDCSVTGPRKVERALLYTQS